MKIIATRVASNLVYLLPLTVMLSPVPMHALQTDEKTTEISFDDYHDAFDDTDLNLPLKTNTGDTFNMLADNPGLILTGIQLSGINEPLWKHTKAPVGRDILYLLPHKITSVEYGGIAANLFFNMTNNMRVSAESLIKFDQLNEISELLTNAASLKDLPCLLALFRKTNIQEHKGGILLQGGFTRGPFSIQFNTALQAVERNLWLNEEDQVAIKNMILQFDPTLQLSNREGMKVAAGLGDTRIKVGINTLNMNSLQVDLGTEIILPTSVLSYVPKMKLTPQTTPTTVQELLDRGLGMIKAVRDYELEPRVGNNGHLGVGYYFESKIGLFHDVANAWFRLSYDKFLEATERRLLMYKKTLNIDDLNPTGIADQDVATIYQYLQQFIVPSGFKVGVQPGGVFNAIASVDFMLNKNIKYALGYDFYAQQEEDLIDIKSSATHLDDLVIEKTQQGSVSQHKLYTEIMYLKPLKNSNLSLGGGGDITVASTSNIGQDWTVYLKCASSF